MMIDSDPEKKLRQVRSLIECDGWKNWLGPVLRDRMEAIKVELLAGLTDQETAALRVEYRVLKGILERPEQRQRELVRRGPAEMAGNGAV